jgi:hypothetical protein
MQFEIIGEIREVETIAVGRGIRQLQAPELALRETDTGASGRASLPWSFAPGKSGRAEVHWYEAHGIGRREIKIKEYLD